MTGRPSARIPAEGQATAALVRGQTGILELVARGAPLSDILSALTRFAEQQSDGMLCSILLADLQAGVLRHGAAPSLPAAYTGAIDGLPIGPAVGSCGTAAFRAERVIVADIERDPLWVDYADLALSHGLRACWSTPILARSGQVLGTFALYYHQPHLPGARDDQLIELVTQLAAIAIERQQADAERIAWAREQAAQLEADAARQAMAATLDRITDGIIALDRRWHVVYLNRTAIDFFERALDIRADQVLHRRFWDAVPEVLGTRFEDAYRRAAAEQTTVEFEDYDAAADRWIEARAYPGPDGLSIYFRDVTERKRAEAERETLLQDAAAARAHLQAVLDQMPLGVAIADAPSGQVTFVNERLREFRRLDPVVVADLEHYDLYHGYHPDGSELRLDEWPLARSITTGEVVAGEEIDLLTRDGARRTVRVNSAPIQDEVGSIVAGVVTLDDVTEKNRAEGALRFLVQASNLLTASLDYETTVQRIAELAVPALADWATVDIVTDGVSRCLAVAHVDTTRESLLWDLRRRYPVAPDGPSPGSRALRSGRPVLFTRLDGEALAGTTRDAEHLRLVTALGPNSAMAVPMVVHGDTIGVMTLSLTRLNRLFDDTDVRFAVELANQAGLAVDNARLYRESRAAVDARDLALAAVEAERNRLRDVLLRSPAPICVLRGPSHVFEFVNPRYQQLLPNRLFLGRTIREGLPELEGQGLFELLDQVYRTGEPAHGNEVPVLLDSHSDGKLEERFFNFVYQPLRGTTGEVGGILVHAVELTEQVRARRRIEALAADNARLYEATRDAAIALATERDRLQQVLDVLPEGIAIADAIGRIRMSNAAARAIWGQAPPDVDVHGYGAFGAWRLDGSPLPSEEAPLARSVLRGEVVRGEQMLITNQALGERRPVLINSAPLRDASGAIAGAVAVFQDISQIKELELQKDEFLAAVSHDLKSPLTTIKGQAQLLRRSLDRPRGPSLDRLRSALVSIDTTTARMTGLIDELLDITRLQMGRAIELDRRPHDLVPLTARLVTEHQQANHRLAVRFVAAEPVVVGYWDAERLERVLMNLLSNAIKYSPDDGEITVTVTREGDADAGWAVVTVEDQGLGIPRADLPHIFDRFYRAANVTTQVSGTGLGLTGARQIVEQHGGTIGVASREGEGSTFTIRLPLGRRAGGRELATSTGQ